MTEYLFENNAESTLNEAIGGGDATLSVQSGDGSLYPNPGAGEAFIILVVGGGNQAYMTCTSRATDTLTVTRTDSYSFPDGSTVKLVLNATILGTFLQKGVYREYDGSPDGLLVANYTGEEVYDSTNDLWYKHCTGTTWKLMSS